MRRAIVVGAIVLLVAMEAFASIGIGVKLLNGNTLCIIGEVGGERLSVELGVGLRSVNIPGAFHWRMIWYSGMARLTFPTGAFAPYVGLGAIGVSLALDSAEGSDSLGALGMAGEAGVRYSFDGLGFPVRLFGGPNLTWIPVSGDVEEVGIGGVGIGWQIGASVPF